MGAAVVALSSDLGPGVPAATAAAAQMDADAPAVGDRGRDRFARNRWRAEPAADARRSPALLLRHRDGLPWRTGAHPPGREISHRLLRCAVVRRHARRFVRGPDRAIYVFLDSGISDPGRAGGVVPTAWGGAFIALDHMVLADSGSACAGVDREFLCRG